MGNGDVSAQQAQVEEVIVTGSYIRRTEGFDAASPVTSYTAEDLEAEGTINMAQVVQNLTFNNRTGTTNSILDFPDFTRHFPAIESKPLQTWSGKARRCLSDA